MKIKSKHNTDAVKLAHYDDITWLDEVYNTLDHVGVFSQIQELVFG